MRTRKHPADARLWSYIVDELRQVSGASFEEDHRLARRIVAVVRRERDRSGARSWAPGDDVPVDVTKVYDLDGDEWDRDGGVWKMRGFNPGEHESAAEGWYVTESLLEQYGPVTEVRKRGARGA